MSFMQISIKDFIKYEVECDSEINNFGDIISLVGSDIFNFISDSNVNLFNNVDFFFYCRIDNGSFDKFKCICNYCGNEVSCSYRVRYECGCRFKIYC